MKKDMDVTGQRFGKLTVLRCMDEKPNYYSKFLCRCDCGKEITIPRYGLFRGKTSCGCDKVRDDLTGKRIRKLTVEGLIKKDEFFFAITWKCKCDCGKEVTYPTILLKNGLVSSCGCDGDIVLSDEELAKANCGEVEGTNTYLLQSALDGVLYENNRTGVRGVYYSAADQRYWATIVFRGKKINIGQHKSLDKAAEARRKAEQLLYGEFLDYYETELKGAIEAGNKQAATDLIEEFTSAKSSPTSPTSTSQISQIFPDKVDEPTSVVMEESEVKTSKPCLVCGKPLPAGRLKYCSRECAYKVQIWRNKERKSRKESRYCEVCGKIVPTDRQWYCSDACQAIGVSLTREASNQRGVAAGRYEIVCTDCGRKVMVASHKSYRCKECQKKARKAQNDASKARGMEGLTRKIGSTAICERCGKEYVVKGATQKYCKICSALQSQESGAKSRKRMLKGEKESRVICAVCGKEFITYAHNPPKCCSIECNKEYRHQYSARYWAEHKK